jgi:hypothetical protein
MISYNCQLMENPMSQAFNMRGEANMTCEQNCLGITILANIVIDFTFNGVADTLEMQIEPAIIMHGQASELSPGVTWNPEFYGQGNPWFAEVIACAINEGRVTSDSIEDEEGKVVWRVRDLTPLQRFNIV